MKHFVINNKKKIIAGGSAALAAVVAACGMGMYGGVDVTPESDCLAANKANQSLGAASSTDAEADTDELVSKLSDSIDVKEKDVYKEETVYAFADANGNANTILVNEVLKNRDGAATLTDKTDLTGIVNLKGDEEFTQNGDTITWQADGNDIYYQGTSDKALPVNVKVTYFLDGKEISANDLAGKSGTVTIRFDYTNNETVTKEINGEEEEINVPFIAITGLMLGDNFTNIQVENGKVMENGDSNIIVGYAMPGLLDSLGAESDDFSDDISIPEYVEVTADVTDFSLDMTATIVMNGSAVNLAGGLDLTEMDDVIDTLTDASGQLVDGSGDLADGAGTLLEKMGEFSTGVDSLKAGADSAKSGVDSVKGGVDSVKSGIDSVKTGVDSVKGGVDSVKTGVDSLKTGIDSLATSSGNLVSGVNAIDESAGSISDAISTLDKSLNKEMTKEEKESTASTAATAAQAAVKAEFAEGTDTYNNVYSQAKTAFTGSMTSEATVNAVYEGLKANNDLRDGLYTAVLVSKYQEAATQYAQMGVSLSLEDFKAGLTAEQSAQMYAYVDAQLKTMAESVTSGIAANGADTMAASVVAACETAAESAAGTAAGTAVVSGIEGAKSEIASQIEAVQENGYSLVTGASALAEGASTLAESMPSLTSGISSLATGAATLQTGTATLQTGAASLQTGTATLQTGAATLQSGAATLQSGASELAGGALKIQTATGQLSEGVSQLSEGADTLKDGMAQFNEEAIKTLADAYNGDVKEFLSRIDAVLQAATEYDTYTMLNDGDEGTTKFIIKTEGISAE